MTELSPVVMLFARTPLLGAVKQRLAADIGEDRALYAHQALVEHALAQLDPLQTMGCLRELWVTGYLELPTIRAWARSWQARMREQVGVDLGASMRHALHTHVRMGRRAVLVGSDVPVVDAAFAWQALEALRQTDVVLAPSEDGGYGLVGASRLLPGLFDGIDWGTGRVLEQTLARADSRGYSVTLLDTVWDVDTLADWHRFEAQFRA